MLEVLASTGLPGLRIKLPNLFATFRIERNHAVRRSREVQHAINHERSGFKWGDVVPVGFIGAAIHFSHVISPRSFQSGDVAAVNLPERRETRSEERRVGKSVELGG